jgi:hypothetical protein
LSTTGAVLANAVCGIALAAGEAQAGTSDDNSNFMFVVICIGEAIALTGAAVGGKSTLCRTSASRFCRYDETNRSLLREIYFY